MISVAILTLNEEEDLPKCLKSLTWCDDIHVIDSGSMDNTVALAKAAGAHVHHHEFESFGTQRNWVLANCEFRYKWVLFLDADECSTPEFHRAMLAAVETASEATAGFYLCWKMILDDAWLKRCDSFPKWQFRLVRAGRATFEDYGHGQKEHAVDGSLEYIREPYMHHAFSKGWARWIDRHNRYSDQEAAQRLNADIAWRDVFSSHGSTRNKALKPLVSRIPGWPVAAFFFRYFLKLGFLEGRPGFVYCLNMAYYEFLIRIKMDQLQRARTHETNGTRCDLL
jgi:glycosyltransferase involved in cell wall biosynthesis